MIDVVIILGLMGIVGGAAWYLYRAKKQGQVCIGCPHCKQCSGKCGCHGQSGM